MAPNGRRRVRIDKRGSRPEWCPWRFPRWSLTVRRNGRRYGGPFPFFKQAVIDDGLLDVVAFKQIGYLEIIKYLQDVFFSSEIRLPEVEYFQTRQLRVTSDQNVPVELDGELIGSCPVEFQMHERQLRVLAPVAAAA